MGRSIQKADSESSLFDRGASAIGNGYSGNSANSASPGKRLLFEGCKGLNRTGLQQPDYRQRMITDRGGGTRISAVSDWLASGHSLPMPSRTQSGRTSTLYPLLARTVGTAFPLLTLARSLVASKDFAKVRITTSRFQGLRRRSSQYT